MSPCRNIALEVCLRPAELPGGTQIPAPFIQVQLCLQNDYILCPADFHGQLQQFRLPAIRPVEVPHPAQIARGEAGSILVTAFQVFGSCDSGALFRPVTDQSAQLAVQLHLRHSGGHCRIHSGKHGRVIDVFADVHSFLLSGRICLIQKQTKEKRRSISCASLWPVLHHLHHLLPEQNEAVIDDFVVVVMSEQPVVELRLFSDFLQEVGQVVVDISAVSQYVNDAAWGAVGDHIVHLIVNAFQIAPSFFILGLTGKLLFPPGAMVDPEAGAHSSESPILFFKIRHIGVQNTIVNIVTPGAAHGEEGISLQVKDLPAHQMDHMGPNALDFPAVPFLYGVFPQQVEVFVVAADKQRGERQVFQPVQAAGILFAAFPYTTEVAADDHKIIPGHLSLLWEVFWSKSLEVAMGIACGIDHDGFTFFRSLYHILVDLNAAPEVYRDFLCGEDFDRIY